MPFKVGMRAPVKCVGKYELRALLVQMPSCAVYDGWDPDLDLRVAIKLIPLSTADDNESREVLDRFRRGAKAAAQLHHPNIVSVYNYGETEDYAYLIMEFVDGPTLKSRFETEHFELPEICAIIGAILEALQYSHGRGVIHRDIKPSNIMFTKDNKVKIVDFGIARLEDGGSTYDNELTSAGMRIGAPAYMSPEQWLTEKVDARTDIYSTGVVLYQMLTGEAPFEGTQDTIMRKVLYGPLMLPSHLSKSVTQSLDRVVTRAMEKQREDRFESAAAFNAALQAAFRHVEPIVRPPAQAKPRSRVPLLGLLMVAMLALGGAAAWRSFVRGDAKQDPPPNEVRAGVPRPPEPPPSDVPPEPPRLFTAPVKPAPDTVDPNSGGDAAARPAPVPSLPYPPVPPGTGPQEALVAPEPRPTPAPDYKPPPVPPKAAGVATGRGKEAGPGAGGKESGSNRVASLLPPDLAKPPKSEPPAPAPEPLPPVRTYGCGLAHASDLGLACIPATDAAAANLGPGGGGGVMVLGVTTGSPADKAGFRKDDVVAKINGSDVRDLSMLAKLAGDATAGHTVAVEVLRNNGRQTLHLAVDQLRH